MVLVLALGLASITCLNTANMKYRFYDELLFVLVVLIALYNSSSPLVHGESTLDIQPRILGIQNHHSGCPHT